MTPAEAARSLEEVRTAHGGRGYLRLVGGQESGEASGPGARLQEARRAAGLSVVQAAAALKLKPATVSAIEAMHFQKLPGLGYALGYARAYAELLDLSDVEGLVDSFRDAWEPSQTAREREKAVAPSRLAVPLGALAALAALAWLIGWAALSGIGGRETDAVVPPDDSIKAWAAAGKAAGGPVASIEPQTALRALRPVRVELRGEDGALVADRMMRAGESISTDGLGRWFVSSPDGGALEAVGYGQTVKVGEDGREVESWRVPDLAGIKARLDAAAAEAAKAQDAKASPAR